MLALFRCVAFAGLLPLWLCILPASLRATEAAELFASQLPSIFRPDILAGLPAKGQAPLQNIYTGFPGLVGHPAAIAFDSSFCAYIADSENDAILELSGYVHVRFASGPAGEGDSQTRLARPSGIALDASNRIHISDTGRHVIRRLPYASYEQQLETLAGGVDQPGSNDGPATQARFREPTGLACASNQVLYVADTGNHTIRRITLGAAPAVPMVSTVAGLAGQSGHVNATGDAARFFGPRGLALDATGNLYVADTGNHVIRKITPAGVVSTLAGTVGVAGYANASGSAAQFHSPSGIKISPAGDLLVADTGNHVIRRVSLTGEVTLHSGQPGAPGSSDGEFPHVSYSAPQDVAIHTGGWLVVADAGNHLVRMSQMNTPSLLMTIAGSRGGPGAADGTRFAARFDAPEAVAIDGDAVYVADTGNHTLRRVDLQSRETETLVGEAGAADRLDGMGSAARLHSPSALARGDGVLYIADAGSHSLRRLTLANLRLDTLSGFLNVAGHEDGPLEEAVFSAPRGLALSPEGELFVADSGTHVIRRISLDTGKVITFAGSPGAPGAADGQGDAARFNSPRHLAFDSQGNLWVADHGNGRIRRVSPDGTVSTLKQPDGGALPLTRPHGLVLGPNDDLFITDSADHTLWVKSPRFPLARAAGEHGRSGVPLPFSQSTRLDGPAGLALNSNGHLVIANRDGSFLADAIPNAIAHQHNPPHAFFIFGENRINYLNGRWAITSYEFGDLPPGISYDAENYCLVGAPSIAGTFLVPFAARNPLRTTHAHISIVVQQAPIAYAITAPDRAYDGTPKPVVFHNPRPDVAHTWYYQINGEYSPPVEVGTYVARIFTTDPNYYGDVTEVFSIVPGTLQTIAFSRLPNRTVGAQFSLVASASSGLPVTFQIVSGDATLDADGTTVTVGSNTGFVTIRARQDGGTTKNVTYAPADSRDRTFLVTRHPPEHSQKIAFAQPPPATYGDSSRTLIASADSGLPVEFDLVSIKPAGIATLAGDVISISGAGTITVRAIQPGNQQYKAAAVTRTITVNKAPLAVSFDPATRLVREPNPVFVPNYTGFVNGDDASDLAPTRPVGVTKAGVFSPAGDYPITFKGGLDANYRFVAGAPAFLTVEGFGGSYETLLLSEGVPLGKLELTVSGNALTYTGVLNLAAQPGPLSVRGMLSAEDGALAAGSWNRAATATLASLGLSFEISGDTLVAEVSRNGSALASGTGARRFAQTTEGRRKLSAPWTGAHTLVLRDPASIDEDDDRALPLGAGHASASIAPTGAMNLRGRLADGAPLTASAIADADGRFRVFARPYAKRTDSALAGQLALVAHPDQARFPGRHLVPAETGRLFWFKAPATSDKSYRAGFAATVSAALDPWLPPAPRASVMNGVTIPAGTLAQRLGLADSATTPAQLVLDFLLPAGRDFGARADLLPETLNLSPAGAFSVAEPTTPASANPTAFSLKVTPATGAFTGSFTLSDQVNPPPARPVTRKATFSGTLRQGPEGRDDTLGHGHFLLSPLPHTESNEPLSGEMRITAPPVE